MTNSERHVESQRRLHAIAAMSESTASQPSPRRTAHDVPDRILAGERAHSADRPLLLTDADIMLADRRPRRTVMELREDAERNQIRTVGPIERAREIRQRAEREAHRRDVDAALASEAVYESRTGNLRAAAAFDDQRQRGNAAVRRGATDVCAAFRAAAL